ncbi:hypothetical protein DY000_02060916 [Brassica cretica]|uniref:Uncharacterized protein n=1 Tax=Brassica cretica TaxID=69181 RepID=A0ABQ7AR28_BRACR|nr:hypothetical protein DY000_02060916 [Brassica cretica]
MCFLPEAEQSGRKLGSRAWSGTTHSTQCLGLTFMNLVDGCNPSPTIVVRGIATLNEFVRVGLENREFRSGFDEDIVSLSRCSFSCCTDEGCLSISR